MPIHRYLCAECGNDFEELVFGAEVPCCPACGDPRPEKQLSAFAVSKGARPAAPPPGPCGSCGDPRGPGACAS